MSPNSDKIIFIDPASDLVEVIAKIKATKATDITLSFPAKSLLLQSLINLQLLAGYQEELGKKITIISADQVGVHLAKAAGLAVSVEDLPPVTDTPDTSVEPIPEYEEVEADEPAPSFLPNPLGSFRTKKLTSIKVEEPEVTALKSFKPNFHVPKMHWPVFDWKPERHHKIALAFAGIGVLIFGTVAFFVIPKAYVAIEVPSESFKKQFTLTLADSQDLQAAGTNILPGRFIEITRENVATFEASGEENKGNPATGQINVVNHTTSIQGILGKTRFVSSSGLGFKIKNDVLVPPARGNAPGRAVVEATSDGGGTKYNVSAPLALAIPNLAEGMKPLLYGEIVGSFSQGTDNIVRIISQEDIDRGKEEASKNVFVAAENELAKQVKRNEEFNPSFIQNDVIDAVPSVTPGSEKAQFEVRVQSRSWTIVVPKGAFGEALANAATFEVDADKRVTQQTLEAAKVEPVESNFLTHRVSLLVSLDGRVGAKVDSQEIARNLAYKKKAEATSYLQSIPSISSSSIDIWPTFLPRVPLIANNVRVQVIYIGE